MSNDVQVARVARITSDVMRRQGKQLSQQRDINGISKGGGGVMGDDIEFVFGSISPRGGGPSVCLGQQKHVVGSYELDSPEHTQRDTTESDNNISSCSTLDIVNKVSFIYVYMYIYSQMCMYMHIYMYICCMYGCVCVCVHCALRRCVARRRVKLHWPRRNHWQKKKQIEFLTGHDRRATAAAQPELPVLY